ncbi:phosphoglycerate kinase [Methanosarcina sp.]|uniref:phosphoglycerate kinase n=1 Tax=Methanosarcina sp. TaxID=2213 RepID=UPI0029895086|nr:phosphoglycerate kinase [Methanosarcina sp.]MDW5549801.1 phosphoglycerate kinase [Methanosarcina sp.]MDW5554849.1 phosphoglycerate kinase [Methanosarcina sp.]MDW5557979.1 phosphoglycerate kinase [Methanosarcina sp.]
MSQETTGKDYLTMDDVVLDDKAVLVRVDFNSPMEDNGNILDDRKIKSHLPTLQSLKHSKVVLMSHQGRPGDEDYTTLEAHAKLATKLLGREVIYEDDIFSSCARNAIKSLAKGEILLLENTRFNAEEITKLTPEEQAKSQMVKKLHPLFDLFINDAFSVSHRSQCSVVGFTLVLPSVAGILMDKEITGLDKAIKCHEHPSIFVLGGAKANDSIKAISNILKRDGADKILTTGVVATVFMMAMGVDVGEVNRKFIEDEKYINQVPIASRLLKEYSDKIVMPEDVALNNSGERQEAKLDKIKGDLPIADIGRKTIENYSRYLKEAKLCVFHGPTGIFELDKFRLGTDELLKAATQASYSVAGGGHTLDAIDQLGLESKFSHISMGGGASITYLSGEPLPGITALKNYASRSSKG